MMLYSKIVTIRDAQVQEKRYIQQQKERGFQCAIEVAIGIRTPSPELTLFRHSISASAFYETVVLGKRWNGDEAQAAGIISKSVPGDQLLPLALKEAAELAKLAQNRSVMKYYKMETKGFVAEEILKYEFPEGKPKSSQPLPPGLQKHVDKICSSAMQSTW